jgi:predicted nucleic acid-binding protein
VKLIGSATVLLALNAAGALSHIQPALKAWAAQGYFISKHLETNILKPAGE